MTELPGIGRMTKNSQLHWYYTEEMPVKALGGQLCRFVLEGYDDDENKADFHGAIQNFLAIEPSVLWEVEEHIFRYYRDCGEYWDPRDGEYLAIDTPRDVWRHVRFGRAPHIIRRACGDRGIYISLECDCDWEEEHGLQIVFKNGLKVNKVGEYDGHCTNADAFGDDSLEDVVYRGI